MTSRSSRIGRVTCRMPPVNACHGACVRTVVVSTSRGGDTAPGRAKCASSWPSARRIAAETMCVFNDTPRSVSAAAFVSPKDNAAVPLLATMSASSYVSPRMSALEMDRS